MYVTEMLANYAASVRRTPPPDEVLHHAKRAVVDWFASAFAGLDTAPVPMLGMVLADDLGHGQAALLRGGAATARAAALIHGAAAHAAEVDDSFRDAMYHPGAATVAAALAAAQSARCSGEHFLHGVIVGYEVSTRIGVALGRAHYRHWHNSGTVGTFGAAAAAGYALSLGEREQAHALATAGTFAAGLQQAFRTDSMSKPLHTGRAAEAGLLAAQLAAAGVTGGLDVLEGERGLGAAMSGEADWSGVTRTLGRNFHIARLTVKNHVGCGHTFAAVDAALELRRLPGFAVEDIRGIQVETYAPAVDIACQVAPTTPNEARFSMHFVVATALVHGSLRQQAYAPQRLSDPKVRALMSCTQVSVDRELDAAFPGERSARVTLLLRDGTVRRHLQRHRVGDPELPLSDEQLNAKFQELVEPVIGAARTLALREQLWDLERRPNVHALGAPA